MTEQTPTERPPLRLIRGDASADEIAALIAVLSAAGAGSEEPAPGTRTAWNDPARLLGSVGPRSGGWRRSALPR